MSFCTSRVRVYDDAVLCVTVADWLGSSALLSIFFLHWRPSIDIVMSEEHNTIQQASDEKWVMALAFIGDKIIYLN